MSHPRTLAAKQGPFEFLLQRERRPPLHPPQLRSPNWACARLVVARSAGSQGTTKKAVLVYSEFFNELQRVPDGRLKDLPLASAESGGSRQKGESDTEEQNRGAMCN